MGTGSEDICGWQVMILMSKEKWAFELAGAVYLPLYMLIVGFVLRQGLGSESLVPISKREVVMVTTELNRHP